MWALVRSRVGLHGKACCFTQITQVLVSFAGTFCSLLFPHHTFEWRENGENSRLSRENFFVSPISCQDCRNTASNVHLRNGRCRIRSVQMLPGENIFIMLQLWSWTSLLNTGSPGEHQDNRCLLVYLLNRWLSSEPFCSLEKEKIHAAWWTTTGPLKGWRVVESVLRLNKHSIA